jgi:hypothetical protein
VLVPANELPGSLRIDSIQFLRAPAPDGDSAAFRNFVLLAGHTTATVLDSAFAQNYGGIEPETVLAVDTLNLSWPPGQWGSLVFSRPFEYDGHRNLLLEMRWSGDDTSTLFVGHWMTPVTRSVFAGEASAEHGQLWPWCAWLRLHHEPTGVADPEGHGPAPLGLRALLRPEGVRLSFDNPVHGPVRVRVFDLAGQLRFSRSRLMAAGRLAIDMDLRASGVYFALVEARGRRAGTKFSLSH